MATPGRRSGPTCPAGGPPLRARQAAGEVLAPATLRALELDPAVDVTVVEVTVVVAAHSNVSICGIPYHGSREVQAWQSLAHRKHADLEGIGTWKASAGTSG